MSDHEPELSESDRSFNFVDHRSFNFEIDDSSKKLNHPQHYLWTSDTNDEWNELYDSLCNHLINSSHRDAANIESKLSVLEQLRSKTVANVIELRNLISLFRENVNNIKRDILSHLPCQVMTLPLFEMFKPVKWIQCATLKSSFPDNNPTKHWHDIISFFMEYVDTLINTQNKQTKEMAALFATQLKKAEDTNNREATILIKQIMAALFGSATIHHDIKKRKVSDKRVKTYESIRRNLLTKEQCSEMALTKYTKRLTNKRNALKLLDDSAEYESDFDDTIREQNIIERKHLERSIEYLQNRINKIKLNSTRYIMRKNKKLISNQINRLYKANGASPKCSAEFQQFMHLGLQHSINQVGLPSRHLF
eukprot:124017_1